MPWAVPQLTRVGLVVDAPVGSQIGAVLGSKRAHTTEFRCGGVLSHLLMPFQVSSGRRRANHLNKTARSAKAQSGWVD